MNDGAKKRTVSPDGSAIQRLRLEKGWRVIDLARKTYCSDKTVASAERGENIYVVTLSKIATALGVELTTLLKGELPAAPTNKERRLQVQITLDIPLQKVEESDALDRILTKLKQIIHAADEMIVVGVEDGSTIITLEMSIEDIERLITAFGPALDDLRIKKLQLPDNEEFTLTKTFRDVMHEVTIEAALRGSVFHRELLPVLPELGLEPSHEPSQLEPPPGPELLGLDELDDITRLLEDDIMLPPDPERKTADTDSDE